jgi:hypothetical protein
VQAAGAAPSAFLSGPLARSCQQPSKASGGVRHPFKSLPPSTGWHAALAPGIWPVSMHTVPLGQALGAPGMQAQPEQQLFPQGAHQLSVHAPPLQQ